MCAADTHPAKGIVLKTDVPHHSLLVSCEAIPGYMDAMPMEFEVRNDSALASLKAGTTIQFTIAGQGQKLFAEDIREAASVSFESEPSAAGQLTALERFTNPETKLLAVGDAVPNFAFTDQTGKLIQLSDMRGKVVVLTFGYSRCPNPNYCYRLSNNLAKVAQRFRAEDGRDLVLMTIGMDPEHDNGQNLVVYAESFHADPAYWHFLTGPLPDVKKVAGGFGVNFWSYEGLLTHTFHTVIIDRDGKMAVNLEGNRFAAPQLCDLVQTFLTR